MDKPQHSRQRTWQLKQVAEGNCAICGKPRVNYAVYCDFHALQHRAYLRKQKQSKPWSKGKRGREPRIKE